jgi:hypothetical protein
MNSRGPNHTLFFQVFDVQINGHVVVDGLDIYVWVGCGVAHDELSHFAVKKDLLKFASESSEFDGTLSIEFVKVIMDL